MKYILIYSYTDIFEKAESEFYSTKYEIPKEFVLVFSDKNLLDRKISELLYLMLTDFIYAVYEAKQIYA